MLKLIKQLKSVLENRMGVRWHIPRAVNCVGLKKALKHLKKINQLPVDMHSSYYIFDEIQCVENQIKELEPEVKLIHKIYFRLLQVEKWLESRKKSDHEKFARLYETRESKIFKPLEKKYKDPFQKEHDAIYRAWKKGKMKVKPSSFDQPDL